MREYQPSILPEENNTITIQSIPQFDMEEYDFNNPKELTKFFFQVERVCRNSRLYKNLINFLREYSDMNKCSFFKNINNIDTYSMKIHIHHDPLTLFDIVNIVYNKKSALNEYISVASIAKEVMWNHYTMKVGLIPLSETIHEIVHNGYLFIPTNIVFGYYKTFIRDYEPYIEKSLKDTLLRNEFLSEEYNYEKETKILKYEPVYMDISGLYEIPKTEDILSILKERIDNIDQKLEKQQTL